MGKKVKFCPLFSLEWVLSEMLARPPIEKINEIVRGRVNYFRVGNSARCFSYIKEWLEKKVRKYMTRVRKKNGYGWNRWSSEYIYENLGLYNDYEIRYI